MKGRDPQPGLAAKYEATCPICDEPIVKGDRVVHRRGSYVHCRCHPGADDQ